LYLGEALNRLEDLKGAMSALKQSIELQPSPRACYALGIVYDRLHEREMADEMYRKAEDLGGW
jgi:Flp pilus assembly protein TadD